MALAGMSGINAHRVVLGANAAHEAADDAPAADHVQHGHLFGHADGMVPQRQSIAQDGDLHALGALHQHGGDDVGRGHVAVGVLVMLVDADAVKPAFLSQHQLVNVAAVQLVALLRVIEAVRQGYPGGWVVISKIRLQVRPGHQMEGVELHARYSARNSPTMRPNSSACSTGATCPQWSITANLAPGMCWAYSSPCASGMIRSCLPQTMSEGTLMRRSRGSSAALHR